MHDDDDGWSRTAAPRALARPTLGPMNNACRRAPLEHAFETRDDNGDNDDLFGDVRAVLLSALQAPLWPAFVTMLRARGPELREKIGRIIERETKRETKRVDDGAERSFVEDRLTAIGISEADVSYWEHAVRMIERADELCDAFHEQPEHAVSGEERHHVSEADKAWWMYTFARVAVLLVAFGDAPRDSAGFQNVLRLAVESARDAYAHWSVALRLAEGATDAA